MSVTKRFGDVVAMNDLTLTVRDREFLVLLGPSGAGKTTTLRTVAGLEKPDDGRCVLAPSVVNTLTPAERNVAFVFQFYALYPFMTAYQNMAFPLKANPIIKAGYRHAREATRLASCRSSICCSASRASSRAGSNSAWRLAVPWCAVRRAYLMDEPLTNLDAKLRTSMRAELKHLQRDLGVTTLYVTHDQVEAMTMGDRVAVLRAGAISRSARPRDLRPADQYLRGLVRGPSTNPLLPCDGSRTLCAAPRRRVRRGLPLRALLAQAVARAKRRRSSWVCARRTWGSHAGRAARGAPCHGLRRGAARRSRHLRSAAGRRRCEAPGPEAAVDRWRLRLPLGSQNGVSCEPVPTPTSRWRRARVSGSRSTMIARICSMPSPARGSASPWLRSSSRSW